MLDFRQILNSRSRKEKYRNIKIVSYLVKNGASPHIQEMYGRNAFHEVALTGNKEMITLIQKAGGNPLARDTQGITPFSIVLERKDKELIQSVLGNDSKLLDSDSNTPIHIALENNAPTEILDLLVQMDYPINMRNKNGVTPLAIAVSISREIREWYQLLKKK